MQSAGRRVRKPSGRARIPVRRSSGNVFADLGLDEAASLQAKADLVARIRSIIEGRRLTQTEAARVLGIGQPKVSALMRGQLDGFSSDRLFRFLNALGRDVEIVVRPHRRAGKPAVVRVAREKLAG